VKTVFDGSLVGLGFTMASFYPVAAQLGLLFILAGVCLFLVFWNRRP